MEFFDFHSFVVQSAVFSFLIPSMFVVVSQLWPGFLLRTRPGLPRGARPPRCPLPAPLGRCRVGAASPALLLPRYLACGQGEVVPSSERARLRAAGAVLTPELARRLPSEGGWPSERAPAGRGGHRALTSSAQTPVAPRVCVLHTGTAATREF